MCIDRKEGIEKRKMVGGWVVENFLLLPNSICLLKQDSPNLG